MFDKIVRICIFLRIRILHDNLLRIHRIRIRNTGNNELLSGRSTISYFSILYRVALLRIRIHRIHMFFDLLDPDPLVRGMDPDPDPALDPDPSIIKQIL